MRYPVAHQVLKLHRCKRNAILLVFEFNEFKPRLKSAKNWFQLTADLNLETLNTILSGTSHFSAAAL